MASAKVEMKIGELAFSGEGDATWLEAQLDKLLLRFGDRGALGTHAARNDCDGAEVGTHQPSGAAGLAKFLQSKNVGKNQVKIFLATALWLTQPGKSRLSTSDVTKALSNGNQRKLRNPSDCLGRNVRKGHCEKDEKGSYVTDEGRQSIGA